MTDDEHLLAGAEARAAPFLTVAIPHYNRRRHLEAVLASIGGQTFRDVEIVVSDDGSTDDSAEALPGVLRALGLPFRYYRQPRNGGFDRNVRFCLDRARGRYTMLLGNDDAVAGSDVLARLADALAALDFPEVAVTNYRDHRTEQTHVRALETAVVGAGVDAAVRHYRSFSFVSGILYDTAAARRERDELAAGETVYYQALVASKILAAGGRLATIAVPAIDCSIVVDGEHGRNWADILRDEPRSFEARDNLSGWLLLAVQRGVLHRVPERRRPALVRRILVESYAFSYPLWLAEGRMRIRWSFAFGYARGLWPATVFRQFVEGTTLRRRDRLWVWAVYLPVTAAGLLLPVRLLVAARPAAATAVRRLKTAPLPGRRPPAGASRRGRTSSGSAPGSGLR